MKVKKAIAIIILSIILLSLFMPTMVLAVEEQIENDITVEENDNQENVKDNQEEVNQNDNQEGVNNKDTDTINNETGINEDVVLDKENTENSTDDNFESDKIIEGRDENFKLNIVNEGNIINEYKKDNKHYIFVPKDVDIRNLVINYEGDVLSSSFGILNKETKTIIGDFTNTESFTLNLNTGDTENIVIMQSDVPAIFINLDSNVTLETVNTGSKDTKYKGSINTTGCDNNISQTGIEFKGRGNTSWAMPKKSYQIKLNKKANFLGIGDSKEKKWVLIANYKDPTLLKNKIVNDLCVNSGLSNCPNSSFADLYVNGDYVGNYLVCDKIEIGSERVNLLDDKGVLIELDNAYYYEEDYYFRSKRGNYYTVKEAVADGDDELTRQAMKSFENSLNAFEDELYSSNPSWEKISKMIDVESFVKYYLINEFAENTDSYFSSCYLYKDGDNDVIHMGPTWDYDSSFGYSSSIAGGGNPTVDHTLLYAWSNDMQRLYQFPKFAKMVNETYANCIKTKIDKIDVNEMSKTIEKSTKMNTIIWSDTTEYSKLKSKLSTFIENRKLYYNSRYSNKQIEYSTHVENNGWITSKRIGVSGTEGQSLRIEGLKIEIGSGYEENISVSYRTHVQDIGWQDWVSEGELSGTVGQSLRVEALQIKLNNSSKYSIRYRVHVQDIGWTDWSYDGEVAGTIGQSKRIEAIEIQVCEKSNYLGSDTKDTSSLINYKGHIQNVGDTGYGSNGEIIGTMGRELRLEGLNIELGETISDNISLEIDEHIENIGWIKGLTDKQYIGTQGKSLRIEALSFKVKGENLENYTIRYRVHIQDIGWQEWKEDGEIAGTTGQSKRIEAIQIQLVEK